jgi:ubiquinone/menaquinone biosynthesis C-methylase UbiE
MSGDYAVIAKSLEQGGEDFVERLGIKPQMRVLDVACGTGNLAIPAAKLGADVMGLDIASNLIEEARDRAAHEGLSVRFGVGDAEALPYEDGTFDIVMTMFGAMFAPRPDVTARELIRVCKPGGIIAMANWTPDGFAADVLKIAARYAEPPKGIPPPVLWGDEKTVHERFKEDIADLQTTRVLITFRYDVPPSEVVEYYIKYFGPIQKAFEALDSNGQTAFRDELVSLWDRHNQATDGTTRVECDYLEVLARRT